MFKIENESEKGNVSHTIKFTKEIFEKLNKIAKENNIPFNLLVSQCYKYAIENSEDAKK